MNRIYTKRILYNISLDFFLFSEIISWYKILFSAKFQVDIIFFFNILINCLFNVVYLSEMTFKLPSFNFPPN